MELKKGNNNNFFQFITMKFLFCLSEKSKTYYLGCSFGLFYCSEIVIQDIFLSYSVITVGLARLNFYTRCQIFKAF